MSEQMISQFDSAADAWSMWMWPMAWQLTFLVLVLGLLTWLLRNRSARLRYALWMLVPIRLVLPPTVALATGWGWWLLPTGVVIGEQAVPQTSDSAAIRYVDVTDDSASGQWPQGPAEVEVSHPAHPLVVEPRPLEVDSKANASRSIELGARQSMPPAASVTWQSWLFLAWVLGVVFFTMRLIYGFVQAAGMIRRSTIPDRTGVCELLEACRGRVGLRRSVRVREMADAGVPMVIGVFRPTIILPEGIDRRLQLGEMQAVLVHELQHVKRHDAFVHLVQALLGIVYFFHPLVWLANRVLGRLREDACDEATVTVLESDRRDYAAGIVRIAETVAGRPPSMALGIVEPSGRVKRRLQRILDPRLPLGSGLSWSALALVLVVAAVFLPSAARPGDPAPRTTATVPKDRESDETVSAASAGGSARDDDGTQDDDSTSESDSSLADRRKPTEDDVTLHGVVLNENGAPVREVRVFVEWYGPDRGRSEDQTDDQGRFAMQAPRKSLRGKLVRATAESGTRQAQHQLPWDDDAALQRKMRLQLHPARRVVLHRAFSGENGCIRESTI